MSFFGLEERVSNGKRTLTPTLNSSDSRQGVSGPGGERRVGATEQAMRNARELGRGRVRYWRPGDKPWERPDDLPEVRVYVLGPPGDEQLLKKTFAANEVYH